MSSVKNEDINVLKTLVGHTRVQYIKLYKEWKRFTIITLIDVMISSMVNPFKEDLYTGIIMFCALIILLIMFIKVAKLGKQVKSLYVIYNTKVTESNYNSVVTELLQCIKSAKYSGDSELRNLYNNIEGMLKGDDIS